MKKEIVKHTLSVFEQIKRTDEQGNEFWTARDIAKILEYLEFRNFKPVIDKAKEACVKSGQNIHNHFVQFHEMVQIGSGAAREIDNVKFSRYACYLIVQNADPAKEVVALGQTYFAVQTRLQELQQLDVYKQLNTEEEKRLFLRQEMTRHNKKLASAAKNAGVITPIDYAIFQNHG
ncbi:MAG TPA: DNA damage-inducible protein D [Puia sp.]